MRFIFIASKLDSPIWNNKSEWEAWCSACGKDCHEISSVTINCSNNDDVYIFNWDFFEQAVSYDSFTQKLSSYINKEQKTEIYIHAHTDENLCFANELTRNGINSGCYTTQQPNSPLLIAIVKLINDCENNEEFLSGLKNLYNIACVKPLCDEIRMLSLSLLLDMAGYKESESEKSEDYLNEIIEVNTVNKLHEKVENLLKIKSEKDNNLKNKFNNFCQIYEQVIAAKSKINSKEVQKSYSELMVALVSHAG